jgi:hypothetical protein
MTEHWTVAALGEDLGERDPYEIIHRLRKLRTEETIHYREQIDAITTARDEAAVAYAAEMKRLEDGIRAEIDWHYAEAKFHLDAAIETDPDDREDSWMHHIEVATHEFAADRLLAILKPKPEPEIQF